MPRTQGINGKQKAAILLITLGSEASAEIFKHLSEEEIEQLTLEIANTRKVQSETRDSVLDDFYNLALARDYIANGGVKYARELLEKSVGAEKANDILGRLTATLQVRPFDFARKADPQQLLNYLQGEHPQTIALILAFLPAEQAASVLSSLAPELQIDVSRRMAIMDRTSPEVIHNVERVLERRLANVVVQDFTKAGGVDSLVKVLTRVDRGTEKTILDSLDIQNPELAEDIRRRMFVFDDLVLLDNRAVGRVLREIDNKELTMALKVCSEEVADLLYRNMSKRMADMIKEDMEVMGPVRLRDVEEAQQKIVAVVRRLEEAGEIIISRGGGDEIIV
jgi:flagellar motor switch protein FliG